MTKSKRRKSKVEIDGAGVFRFRLSTFDFRLSTGFRLSTFDFRLFALPFAVCLLPACNEPPAVNPWVDDSIPQEAWYTPSSESIRAAQAQPSVRHRPIPPSTAPAVDESVPHFPLWWEDPFEDQGDNDDTFAWTWQDYFAMPYGEARYILNTLGFPASVIVQPPWATMVSDGRLAMRGISLHDARLGRSTPVTAGRSDFGFDEEDSPLPQVATRPAGP